MIRRPAEMALFRYASEPFLPRNTAPSFLLLAPFASAPLVPHHSALDNPFSPFYSQFVADIHFYPFSPVSLAFRGSFRPDQPIDAFPADRFLTVAEDKSVDGSVRAQGTFGISNGKLSVEDQIQGIIAGFSNTQENWRWAASSRSGNVGDIGLSVEVESLQSENWSAEQLGSR